MRERSRNKRKIEKYEKQMKTRWKKKLETQEPDRKTGRELPCRKAFSALSVSHHRLLCDISNGHL